MSYIKEPKGVDFIIKSEPLTNDERIAISEFIRQYKLKHSTRNVMSKTRVTSSQQKTKRRSKNIAASKVDK